MGRLAIAGMGVWLGLAGGCGDLFAPRPAPLFVVPLVINNEPVESAIVDTGGGYELMLQEAYDLALVGQAEVLAFGGMESVGITEGFAYTVGGLDVFADAALVGVSVCDCNGVGFRFFRKNGVVLGLDFADLQVHFLESIPGGGVVIPFLPPPPTLPDFHSAFVEVEVSAGGESLVLLGLLDTGTNATVMRRGLIGSPTPLLPNHAAVTVAEPRLGTVAVRAGLFDTPGLPDIILGTDVMRAWADRWYFSFTSTGGSITVFTENEEEPSDARVKKEKAFWVPNDRH